MTEEHDYVAEEREIFARWLDISTRIGFAVLVATFLLYVLGILPSHIPLADLPHYWQFSVTRYVAETGEPTGWGWVRRVNEGDLATVLGIAILAAANIFCYARTLPDLIRRHEWAFAVMCALELLVFLVAASGILGYTA
jgi:hypothetical protein